MTVANGQRNGFKKFPQRWAEDTLAGVRCIARAVGGAQDVAAVLGQELVVDPVHGHGNMATPVDVGAQGALMVYEKTLVLAPVAAQDELLRLPGAELAYPSHGYPTGIASHP